MQAYSFVYPMTVAELEAEPRAWGWWLLDQAMMRDAEKKSSVEYAAFCVELRDRYKLPGALALHLIVLDAGYGEVSDEEFKSNLAAAKRPDCLELFVTNRAQFDKSLRIGAEIWRDFANRNEG